MADRTVCIPTLGLQPGQRLAQAVRRAGGGLLLPAGIEIDLEQIRQLLQRGIEFVYVLEDDTRDAAQIERDIAAAATRVSFLFRGQGSAARQTLASAIADYRRQAAS